MFRILIILFIVSNLFGISDKASDIKPAKMYFMDLDIKDCFANCLNDLKNQKLYYTFMAKYNEEFANEELKKLYIDIYNDNIDNEFNDLVFEQREKVKIAVLAPSSIIRGYLNGISKAIISYFLSRDIDFEMKIYDSYDENSISLQNTISEIKTDGFNFVIAAITENAIPTIINEQSLYIYVPTINIKNSFMFSPKIFYGGIDYEQQIKDLMNYSNHKVGFFYYDSPVTMSLTNFIIQENPNIVYSKQITKDTSFKYILKNNNSLNNTSVFLNTPVLQTSLLLSQLRAEEIKPYSILSTQINYNPKLLYLSQYQDRKKMFITNIISEIPSILRQNNIVMNNDISYNWVNYSTLVGLDFFYTNINQNSQALFEEQMQDNQVIYKNKIMIPKGYNFQEIQIDNQIIKGLE